MKYASTLVRSAGNLVAGVCCALGTGVAHANCADLLERHVATDMALDEKRFDQGEATGFRVLAGAGCYAEAEQLILAYIRARGSRSTNVWWHAAQMAASAGRYGPAAQHARNALESAPPKDDPLLWNDYVLASIAFFERDRIALQRHRDVIARQGMSFWGHRMNVNMLDTMLENFDLPYEEIGAKAFRRWQAEGAATQ